MNTDPRDVFVSLNPLGLGERELKKDKTGFADMRTHNDYLVFLAGYKAGTVDGEEREYQRHRPMNAEGCKPEISIMLSGTPCVGAVGGRDLNKAEGGTPDSNIYPGSSPTSKALCAAKAADNELLMAQVGLLAAVRRIYPNGSRLMINAGGNKIEVEVTGHCAAWWSRPGYIYGKNCKTDKPRTFHHSAVLEVLQ
ncbi:hypothetical protein [Pseudomonas sp. CC120222-01a]|uniref:hypothetical protein n=1 Tax=Pseudomonas sp. CC120222-01a TaxID=1378075 RepID=UPI000D964ECA|nr:hypothetical protein [Pseudomonas sp. CC120222-01a]PVZ43960.1 hypothetical protein N430_00442 [Pseudomonas sp. CC120222-01a]